MIRKLFVVAIVGCAVMGGGCHRERSTDGGAPTETIAPATPPTASVQAESDTGLTQTVEIGEERSASEGGGLSEPATATLAANPSATAVTTSGVKPKARK